ncbi:MAG TPA: FAD-binding oxidoreductase [Gammaproteobacteria bacterium]|nr:FAD-binding oxidoreductase [Gammaproteobacteria bacterium]
MTKTDECLAKLSKLLSAGSIVHGDELDRVTSYWDSAPARAVAMVSPRSTEEVSEVLRICFEHGQQIVTQGGMTNCVKSADPLPEEIILSTEKLKRIEVIDTVGGTVTVEAGVVLQTLQEACLEKDMVFPLDLGARGSCTIGGNVATNAGGINVLRYGMMRNLVLGMEVVLADGTILSSMNQMLKNNTAYDLKQLFIGSEGTLGIVTRVVLRLFPKPLSCQTALLAMDTFNDVIDTLKKAQRELGGTLSAYEVMWGNYVRGVTGETGHAAPMSRDFPFYVLIEAEGSDPTSDDERFQRLLESIYESSVIVDAVVPKSETERLSLWKIREDFECILEPEPFFLYDVSLPIVAMDEYVSRVETGLTEKWPACEAYVLGHIADGNIHFFIRPNAGTEVTHLHEDCDGVLYQDLKQYHGSISAEHGIGMEKKSWLSESRSEAEINVMRAMKKALDPTNLLNPGRVF